MQDGYLFRNEQILQEEVLAVHQAREASRAEMATGYSIALLCSFHPSLQTVDVTHIDIPPDLWMKTHFKVSAQGK